MLTKSREFDHALLVGPPGVGKGAVTRVIAEEMAISLPFWSY
jgi:Holliday junction resolvasome RuvABC ATP-dependent DNA helicase subunit